MTKRYHGAPNDGPAERDEHHVSDSQDGPQLTGNQIGERAVKMAWDNNICKKRRLRFHPNWSRRPLEHAAL